MGGHGNHSVLKTKKAQYFIKEVMINMVKVTETLRKKKAPLNKVFLL